MSRLAQVKCRELERVAKKLGFVLDHQTGSHAVYRREIDKRRAVIPIHHGRAMKIRTVHGVLKDLGITPEEFLRLAK